MYIDLKHTFMFENIAATLKFQPITVKIAMYDLKCSSDSNLDIEMC